MDWIKENIVNLVLFLISGYFVTANIFTAEKKRRLEAEFSKLKNENEFLSYWWPSVTYAMAHREPLNLLKLLLDSNWVRESDRKELVPFVEELLDTLNLSDIREAVRLTEKEAENYSDQKFYNIFHDHSCERLAVRLLEDGLLYSQAQFSYIEELLNEMYANKACSEKWQENYKDLIYIAIYRAASLEEIDRVHVHVHESSYKSELYEAVYKQRGEMILHEKKKLPGPVGGGRWN